MNGKDILNQIFGQPICISTPDFNWDDSLDYAPSLEERKQLKSGYQDRIASSIWLNIQHESQSTLEAVRQARKAHETERATLEKEKEELSKLRANIAKQQEELRQAKQAMEVQLESLAEEEKKLIQLREDSIAKTNIQTTKPIDERHELHQTNEIMQLRQLLAEGFNEGELKELCFDLDISYENLDDKTTDDKAKIPLIYQLLVKQGALIQPQQTLEGRVLETGEQTNISEGYQLSEKRLQSQYDDLEKTRNSNIYQPVRYEKLHRDIYRALSMWKKQPSYPEKLLDYLLIVREQRRADNIEHLPTRWCHATNQVLEDAVNQLEIINKEQAKILRSRFFDGNSVIKVGNMMNVADATVMRMQRNGLDNLTKIILNNENEKRLHRRGEILSKFHSPTYKRLFGVNDCIEKLQTQLFTVNKNWVTAIVGIGGIGKTSLADFVTRQMVDQFAYDDVAWIPIKHRPSDRYSEGAKVTINYLIMKLANHFWGAKSTSESGEWRIQVQQRLKSSPHLVVIDNLESEEDTAKLMDQLGELANPSRFLLTTRTQPESEAGLCTIFLDELSQSASLNLMRDYAAEMGFEMVAEITDDELNAVYERVGGNPQALKLVVSLFELLPFEHLLKVFKSGSAGPVENLYKHIYRQSWNELSEKARTLLSIMPLIEENGEDSEYLQTLSGLDEASYLSAVQELQRQSLLEVRGGVHNKQYGIHRLTDTLVKNEIANQW